MERSALVPTSAEEHRQTPLQAARRERAQALALSRHEHVDQPARRAPRPSIGDLSEALAGAQILLQLLHRKVQIARSDHVIARAGALSRGGALARSDALPRG